MKAVENNNIKVFNNKEILENIVVESVGVETLLNMFIAGAKALEQNKEMVDSLNVFPVPDGDTGTNMSLTINSAVKAVAGSNNSSLQEFSKSLANGALRGARGNSGVILSQIVKGLTEVFEKSENNEVFVSDFANAFKVASEVAYKAVTKPQEGTILTIIRAMAEQSENIAKNTNNLVEFFNNVLMHAEFVLQQTPEMLPVLKRAGVIDAGGRGLLVIFAGMQKVLNGQWEQGFDFSDSFNNLSNNTTAEGFDEVTGFTSIDSIEFAYCTEFMVSHINDNANEQDIEELKNKLMQIGDSVVCVGDLDLVKVHVHTNEPSKALGFGLELGELVNIKIDNMLEQFRGLNKSNEVELKELGMVSVAAGDGLESLFKDILVDEVIKGGQTMNPSASDIAKACNNIAAKTIFVLPNNKNIVLSAEQAKELTDKNIVVIPTTSIAEGVAAALAFDPNADEEENYSEMVAAKNSVVSGAVTHAVRDTSINDLEIEKGDIIGLDNSTILVAEKNINTAAKNLVKKLNNDEAFTITVFYGKDVNSGDVSELENYLTNEYNDKEIVFIDGGQPVYYYLISIE